MKNEKSKSNILYKKEIRFFITHLISSQMKCNMIYIEEEKKTDSVSLILIHFTDYTHNKMTIE